MSNPAPNESAPVEEAPDPSIARAERRLRLLEELSEIGMELARALKPGAGADEITPAKDPAAAFAPLSRAIRLTLALEAKTCQELRDLKAGVVRTRKEEPVHAARRLPTENPEASVDAAPRPRLSPDQANARKERVFDLVVDVAMAECGDIEAIDRIYRDLKARLSGDEAYRDCPQRPLRETVERLCKDLKLAPDWSQWDGEGWDAGYVSVPSPRSTGPRQVVHTLE